MRGYISEIGGFLYFAQVDKTPPINSFVIQGKVKAVCFYTDDRMISDRWFRNNHFSRKYKVDKYTREVVFTNDSRLTGVLPFPVEIKDFDPFKIYDL